MVPYIRCSSRNNRRSSSTIALCQGMRVCAAGEKSAASTSTAFARKYGIVMSTNRSAEHQRLINRNLPSWWPRVRVSRRRR